MSNSSFPCFLSPPLPDYGPYKDLKCLCEMMYGMPPIITFTHTDARCSPRDERWRVVLEINGDVHSVAVSKGPRWNAEKEAVDIALAELILENDARF